MTSPLLTRARRGAVALLAATALVAAGSVAPAHAAEPSDLPLIVLDATTEQPTISGTWEQGVTLRVDGVVPPAPAGAIGHMRFVAPVGQERDPGSWIAWGDTMQTPQMWSNFTFVMPTDGMTHGLNGGLAAFKTAGGTYSVGSAYVSGTHWSVMETVVAYDTYFTTVKFTPGTGAWEVVEGDTPDSAPAKPAVPALSAAATSIAASWTAPADGGSAITGYTAKLYDVATGGEPVASLDTTSTSATFAGLTAEKTYWVSVTAKNAVGASPESDRTETRTLKETQTETEEIPVTTTLPAQVDGALSWIVSDQTAALGAAELIENRFQKSGDLGSIKVSDERRVSKPGWGVSATVSGFAQVGGSGSIDQKFLGWTPRVEAGANDVQPGAAQNAGDAVAARSLATAAAGKGLGVSDLNAGLVLDAPASETTPPGDYSATVTLTLTSN